MRFSEAARRHGLFLQFFAWLIGSRQTGSPESSPDGSADKTVHSLISEVRELFTILPGMEAMSKENIAALADNPVAGRDASRSRERGNPARFPRPSQNRAGFPLSGE